MEHLMLNDSVYLIHDSAVIEAKITTITLKRHHGSLISDSCVQYIASWAAGIINRCLEYADKDKTWWTDKVTMLTTLFPPEATSQTFEETPRV